jgi:hypothetical protein
MYRRKGGSNGCPTAQGRVYGDMEENKEEDLDAPGPVVPATARPQAGSTIHTPVAPLPPQCQDWPTLLLGGYWHSRRDHNQ